MAKTAVADIIIPTEFEKYAIERTAELSNFGQCGIVEHAPEFDALASGGGREVKMPFWKDLTATRQLLSDSASLTVNKITSDQDIARMQNDAQVWSVNHHSIARDGQVYFGTLKTTRVDEEGTLRLGWWPGNEKMKHLAVEARVPSLRHESVSVVTMLDNLFDPSAGLILEGVLKLPGSAESPPVGLFLPQRDGTGAAILVRSGGLTEFGPIGPDGAGFKAEHRADREWKSGVTARFRLLLKGSLLEFYLDDLLMQCYSLPHAASGRIGLLPGGSADAFANLKAWRLDTP